ncbi:EAL domain-containing protein [Deinococcus arcticus]|uniref:GGDEF-domain containing protein n=1 Tax=Deinococcus arcticus TaxID=2136176 RepID=A0A2T3W5W9_9DEIO|nr:EAL domain-containing protein [Deinococcus arcticus]PTA67184.1 hypothetical protein C8263_13895 [Deinococcus arcticus]
MSDALQEVLDLLDRGNLEAAHTALASLSAADLPYGRGEYHKAAGDLTQAQQDFEQAREAATLRGDLADQARSLVQLAHLHHLQLDSEEALRLLQEAAQLRGRLGDMVGRVNVLCNIAGICLSLNDDYQAMLALQDAQTTLDQMPASELPLAAELHFLNTLARALTSQGKLDEAAHQYRRCLERARSAGAASALFLAAINLGDVYLKGARYAECVALLEPLIQEPELPSLPDMQAYVQLNLAQALFHLGHAEARACAEQTQATFEGVHDPDGVMATQLLLARIYQGAGEHDLARAAAAQALDLATTDRRKQVELDALNILAELSEPGHPAQAVAYLRQVLALQAELGAASQDRHLRELTAQAALDSAQRRAAYEQALRLQAEETVQRQLQELERGRLYDPLTGLPNRVMLRAQLAQQVERARRVGTEFLLVSADLNRFQLVNDAYGQDAADEVLRAVAGRLRAALQDDEMVARVGGDEFALILLGRRADGTLDQRLAQALDALNAPVPVGGHPIRMSWSVGAAHWPSDAREPEALRQASELALNDAKAQGEACVAYDRRAHAHAGLEGALARALERGEFELHFQPMIDVRSRQVVCAEALLRWRSAEHGLQSPGIFMPILERSGQIVEVGAWVLQAACAQAARWGGTRVAVNLSAQQFARSDLRGVVRAALQGSGLEPSCLELEITESLMMQSPERAARVLSEFQADGVRVMLDDFGTGYSSLGYLARFPLSGLKIDRGFVTALQEQPGGRDAAIVRAMVGLSRDLGLELVAEGVETLRQADLLAALGVQVMQGYYFARPTANWQPPRA